MVHQGRIEGPALARLSLLERNADDARLPTVQLVLLEFKSDETHGRGRRGPVGTACAEGRLSCRVTGRLPVGSTRDADGYTQPGSSKGVGLFA